MSRIMHLSKLLKEKKITSVELTKQYLKQIEKIDSKLNSYVSVNHEMALKQAAKADLAISKNESISVLAGIPMAIKDNIVVEDINTTCCSKMLASYKPTYTATVLSKLFKKNAVLLGKNNMDEFAMGSFSNTGIFGNAYNPYDIRLSPGGSSGGGASSVSANLAAYSLGSDTAGSARQPASFCGIVALKPTYGMVSRYGLISLAPSFDQISPMTSSVTDCAILFDAISGYDEKDMMTINASPKTFKGLNGDISQLKIGVPKNLFENTSKEIAESLSNALKIYQTLGVKIENVSLPNMQYALPIYYILACSEIFSSFGRYDGIRYGHQTQRGYVDLDDMIAKTRSESLGEDVKRRIMLGMYFLDSRNFESYYKKASILRTQLMDDYKNAFQVCDVILTPTTPTIALPHNYSPRSIIEKYSADNFVVPANICKLPAISLPCGKTSAGLPIGMQLLGPECSEGLILNSAFAFEREVALNLQPELSSNLCF